MSANCSDLLDLDLGNEDGANLLAGVLVTFVSSFLNTASTLCMKLAQDREKRKPHEERAYKWNGIIFNWFWLLSFLVLLSSNGAEAVALMLASQSVIAPFAGLNIMLAMVIGPRLLGEEVRKRDIGACAVILSGTLLCTLFGPQTSIDYDVDYLIARWSSVPMVSNLVALAVLGLAVFAVLRNDLVPERLVYLKALLTAFLVGSFGALVATVLKGMMEILQGGLISVFPVAFALYFGLSLIVCVTYIVIINMGLERYEGTLFYPLYLGWLIIGNVVNGSIYFMEYTCYGPLQLIVFPIGCCVTISGMLMLAQMKKKSSSGRVVGYTLPMERKWSTAQSRPTLLIVSWVVQPARWERWGG